MHGHTEFWDAFRRMKFPGIVESVIYIIIGTSTSKCNHWLLSSVKHYHDSAARNDMFVQVRLSFPHQIFNFPLSDFYGSDFLLSQRQIQADWLGRISDKADFHGSDFLLLQRQIQADWLGRISDKA